jgi:hypothetical protein
MGTVKGSPTISTRLFVGLGLVRGLWSSLETSILREKARALDHRRNSRPTAVYRVLDSPKHSAAAPRPSPENLRT